MIQIEMFSQTSSSVDVSCTFGALSRGCAAALANIEVIEEGLIERAEMLRGMMEGHRVIGYVRGRGLLIGVEIVGDRGSKRPAVEELKRSALRPSREVSTS